MSGRKLSLALSAVRSRSIRIHLWPSRPDPIVLPAFRDASGRAFGTRIWKFARSDLDRHITEIQISQDCGSQKSKSRKSVSWTTARLNQQYTGLNARGNDGYSSYNALIVNFVIHPGLFVTGSG